jgi:hypothetical protein
MAKVNTSIPFNTTASEEQKKGEARSAQVSTESLASNGSGSAVGANSSRMAEIAAKFHDLFDNANQRQQTQSIDSRIMQFQIESGIGNVSLNDATKTMIERHQGNLTRTTPSFEDVHKFTGDFKDFWNQNTPSAEEMAKDDILKIDNAFKDSMQNKIDKLMSDGYSQEEAQNKLAEICFGTDGTDGVFGKNNMLEPGEDMSEIIRNTAKRYLPFDVYMKYDVQTGKSSIVTNDAEAVQTWLQKFEGEWGDKAGEIDENIYNSVYEWMGYPKNEDSKMVLEMLNMESQKPNELINMIQNSCNIPDNQYVTSFDDANGVHCKAYPLADVYAAQVMSSESSPVTELYGLLQEGMGDTPEARNTIAQALSNRFGLRFGVDTEGKLCAWELSAEADPNTREMYGLWLKDYPNPDDLYKSYSEMVKEGTEPNQAMDMSASLNRVASVANDVSGKYTALIQAHPEIKTAAISAAAAIAPMVGLDPSIGVVAVNGIDAGVKAVNKISGTYLEDSENFEAIAESAVEGAKNTVEQISESGEKQQVEEVAEVGGKAIEATKKERGIPEKVDTGYEESSEKQNSYGDYGN